MIVAVTGGTGFLGRALVTALARAGSLGEIRVLARKERREHDFPRGVRLHRGDLSDPGTPLGAFVSGVDVLFHCAGEIRREEAMRALHVEGTRRLIDAAAGRIARWVQLSSIGAYGRRLQAGTIDENSSLAPEGEYEITKVASDALVAEAAARGAFRHTILRPSIVFGPRMPNQSLYQLVSAIAQGRFAFIGSGRAIANYVYVDDVADALLACASSERASGVYNLSDDRPLEAFVGVIARELGRRPPSRRLPEGPLRLAARALGWIPGFPLTSSRVDALTRAVSYPSRRMQEDLGFRFAVSIEKGLHRFVQDWGERR